MVGADNGVVISTPNIVHARFELDHVLDTSLVSGRPIHPADNAAQWRAVRGSGGVCHLLECCEHSILIESSISQIDFGIVLDLKLPAELMGGCVDACHS